MKVSKEKGLIHVLRVIILPSLEPRPVNSLQVGQSLNQYIIIWHHSLSRRCCILACPWQKEYLRPQVWHGWREILLLAPSFYFSISRINVIVIMLSKKLIDWLITNSLQLKITQWSMKSHRKSLNLINLLSLNKNLNSITPINHNFNHLQISLPDWLKI